MSNTNDSTPTTAPEAAEESVEKQSFAAKAKSFVKTHKKTTIAVGALVALTGVSAYTGRKTAPQIDTLGVLEVEPEVVAEVDDVPVAAEN